MNKPKSPRKPAFPGAAPPFRSPKKPAAKKPGKK